MHHYSSVLRAKCTIFRFQILLDDVQVWGTDWWQLYTNSELPNSIESASRSLIPLELYASGKEGLEPRQAKLRNGVASVANKNIGFSVPLQIQIDDVVLGYVLHNTENTFMLKMMFSWNSSGTAHLVCPSKSDPVVSRNPSVPWSRQMRDTHPPTHPQLWASVGSFSHL